MAERTSYTPGTFSWTDLATTDQDAAKQFYGQLFGWQAVDFPIDENTTYSMMQIGGKDVAAISPQPQQQRDAMRRRIRSATRTDRSRCGRRR